MPPRTRKRPLSRGASSSRPVRSKNARAPTPTPSSSPASSSSSPSSSSSASPPRRPFPWPFQQIAHHDRFASLSTRSIVPTRFLDEGSLRELGLFDEVIQLVGQVGWDAFVRHRFPTYSELTLEFLSTFKVDWNPPIDADILRVSFYCMGVLYSLSLAEFSALLSLPPFGDTHITDSFIAEHAWFSLTGKRGYSASRSKSSQLRSQALRIIHRFMAHSLFGRAESVGVVGRNELFFLHAMSTGRPLYTAIWFVKHISHVISSGSGKICIGGLITYIAHSLGFRYEEGRDTLVAGNDSLDRVTLQHMGICRVMSGNQAWLLDAEGHPVRPDRPVPEAEHVEQQGEPIRPEPVVEETDVPRQSDDVAGPSSSSAPSSYHSTSGWTVDSMMAAMMGRMDTLSDQVVRLHTSLSDKVGQLHSSLEGRVDRMETEVRALRDELRRRLDTSSEEGD